MDEEKALAVYSVLTSFESVEPAILAPKMTPWRSRKLSETIPAAYSSMGALGRRRWSSRCRGRAVD